MSDSAIASKKPNPVWQMHIQEGNAKMREGFYQQAQSAYIQAMELAEGLLESAIDKQDDASVIHEFVIACQNLAEVYDVMNLEKESERLLLAAHNKTLKVMKTENLSMQFRTEAYRGFQAVFMQLAEFYGRSGECQEKMTEYVTESKLHAQKFLQEVYRLFESNEQN